MGSGGYPGQVGSFPLGAAPLLAPELDWGEGEPLRLRPGEKETQVLARPTRARGGFRHR